MRSQLKLLLVSRIVYEVTRLDDYELLSFSLCVTAANYAVPFA